MQVIHDDFELLGLTHEVRLVYAQLTRKLAKDGGISLETPLQFRRGAQWAGRESINGIAQYSPPIAARKKPEFFGDSPLNSFEVNHG